MEGSVRDYGVEVRPEIGQAVSVVDKLDVQACAEDTAHETAEVVQSEAADCRASGRARGPGMLRRGRAVHWAEDDTLRSPAELPPRQREQLGRPMLLQPLPPVVHVRAANTAVPLRARLDQLLVEASGHRIGSASAVRQ
ncbi:hypothetical protein GCM10011588_28050 [Nocardia jinanensis]|uniref:Uncharacterized protein n=1 Tax=Nocardia jinanensis TaxID=382504 RepID=A0A917VTA2_9NOCA|nr:hypothetical protein GCM10011588_28050 [Nocardia jinanensis]